MDYNKYPYKNAYELCLTIHINRNKKNYKQQRIFVNEDKPRKP